MVGETIPRGALLPNPGINVFNLGNDAKFHSAILKCALANPGIVIMHDLNIYGLVRQAVRWNATLRRRVVRYLADRFGNDAEDAFTDFRRRKLSAAEMHARFPLSAFPLERASGVVVHSRGGESFLRGQTSVPVCFLPLPSSARDWPSPRPDAGTTPRQLIVFGHLGGNRRLEQILEALASFSRRQELRLTIVGKISHRFRLLRAVRRHGLGDLVKVKPFLRSDELDRLLARMDLALNLRHPTMGEASGSQLRIWDHSLAALVTPEGWYAEAPAGTVGLVRVETERADLHDHFEALLRNPATYRTMGAAGRAQLVRHHGIENYAERLLDFAATRIRAKA